MRSILQIVSLASFVTLAACGGSGGGSNASTANASGGAAGGGDALAAYRAETIGACMTGLGSAPPRPEVNQSNMERICACTVDMHMTGKTIEQLRQPGGPSPSRNLDYCIAEAQPIPGAAPAGGAPTNATQ